jgi:predicted ribosome quality control (RQC) complex YloA/Tae2 family protein
MGFWVGLECGICKARGSGKVEVSYTNPKYLQKVKGSKPGMVKVEKEIVIIGQAFDPLSVPAIVTAG